MASKFFPAEIIGKVEEGMYAHGITQLLNNVMNILGKFRVCVIERCLVTKDELRKRQIQ